MVYLLALCTLVAFLFVFLFTPWFMKYLHKIGLIVHDQNKSGKPLVPLSGGVVVFGGFIAGLLVFIFFSTFFGAGFSDERTLNLIFASMVSVFLISIVGFLDDLVIKSDKSTSVGLKQWQKPLLTLVAAVPLMVVNAANTKLTLPLFGYVDFGIFYPLLLIPIGVVGASNMVNMLAGFNGVEAGMGLVYTGMLGAYAYYHDQLAASLIAFVAFGALLAFLYYNKYPARILPGDSLTYLLGAVLVSIVVIGDFEKAGLVIAVPFFIEFILKLRGKFKKQSYGQFKDGKLLTLDNGIYSIPHIFILKGKCTEKQVMAFMMLIQLGFSSLIWLI